MKLFDTHCHLASRELGPQAEALALRAQQAGVAALTIISADALSLRQAKSTAEKVRAQGVQALFTAGIHPHEADAEEMSEAVWAEVEALALEASAIGETGLDFFYNHSDRESQIALFDRHMDLAARLKKPLVIHCRNAADDVLSLLERQPMRSHPNPGILHCFTEDLPVAQRLLDLGYYISFSGILTFKNADKLREVARYVPLDRLLIETDSPYLAPVPERGKSNEPAFVSHVFRFLCGLRLEAADQVEEALWKNSCRVFGWEEA